MHDYSPPPSDLPVRLYCATERLGRLDAELRGDLGWRAVVGDGLIIWQTPSDHFNMMTGERVAKLAQLLSAALQQP